MFCQNRRGVVLFKGWSNGWLQYRSWRNEFKCLSERDGEHIEIKKWEGKKDGKKFYNQTIWFLNKYVNAVGVLTFSTIITGFPSLYIEVATSSIIVVMVRTVLLGMSQLSLSTQWTYIHSVDSSIWCGRDCCIRNTSWVLLTSCNRYGVVIDWVMRLRLGAKGEGSAFLWNETM